MVAFWEVIIDWYISEHADFASSSFDNVPICDSSDLYPSIISTICATVVDGVGDTILRLATKYVIFIV